ncbi:hypothetical protein ACJX0J_010746, partial [Zea mays]
IDLYHHRFIVINFLIAISSSLARGSILIVIFVYHVNLDNALMWHDKKNIMFLQKNILLFLIPWYMYIDKSIKASALILQAFGLVVCDISLMFGFNAAICNF